MLAKELDRLKRVFLEYATLIEGMIDKSIRGLLEKKENLLQEVIKVDEPKANGFDNRLDEECTLLMAQFEPVARDLRMVLMLLKMNHDLERMGDHAVNICESGLFIIARPEIKVSVLIPQMAEGALTMLKESIESFINKDVQLAKKVLESDNRVDDLGESILKDVTRFLKDEHDGVKRALHVIRISYNLERIADLSSNIAEEVIFMVEGKDIKHSH